MIHTRLSATLLAILSASFAFCVTVNMTSFPARCGLDNGEARAIATNGIPPYTYAWSTGETTQTINGLAPGTYTVTVTDDLGAVANGSATVVALFELAAVYSFLESEMDCDMSCSGEVRVIEDQLKGTAPYSYSNEPQTLPSGFLGYGGLCAGSANVITVTDDNGCPGQIDIGSMIEHRTNSTVQVSNITSACGGAATGTMTVTLIGGDGYSYVRVWNQNTQSEQFYYPPLNTPYMISGLPAGDYTVSSWVNGMNGPLCTYPAGGFTVPELPGPCGTIGGTVFNDADQDCTQDPDEPGLPYRILTVQPGPQYGITDAQGHYLMGMPFGSYTLAQPLVEEAQQCPAAAPVPFTVNSANPNITINLADSSLLPHDLEVLLLATAFRPGFPFKVWVRLRNNTAYASGTVALSLSYPTLLDPVTFNGDGTANGGNAEWNFPVVPAYTSHYFTISGTVPPDPSLMGEELVFTANATNSISEASLDNNTQVATRTVTGSFDPNDKQGSTNATGSTDQFFLDSDAWIDYTVRFQNTGTDTAFTVVIRDEIGTDFDMQSLEITAASHAFTPSFGEGRELVITFSDILLPDSTTDFLGSQGFFSYRIKPKNTITAGDVLENTAGIYFDFNPPIITNTTAHTVEFSTGVQANGTVQSLWLMPNPTSGTLEVRVSDNATTGMLQVVSVDGRVALQQRMNGPRTVLDVAPLARGLYTLNWHDANGTVTTKRFVRE